MVVNIAIKGGLGNQLFQYALGNYLQQNYKASVFYDRIPLTAESENLTKRSFLLDRLFNNMRFTTSQTHNLFYAQSDAAPLRWYKKITRLLSGCHYIAETDPACLALKDKHVYYLDGYWQHASVARLLVSRINACTGSILANGGYAAQIAAAGQSVAIHIRRGDYVDNAFINSQHGHCDLSYYQRAMQAIEGKVSVSAYFIFSDDMRWAKENITSSLPIVFVEGHDQEPVTDLLLMKSCSHQIIANSSYSCWAAYLNTDPQKVVIAPVNWTMKEKTNTLPLSDPAWMLI